MKKLKDLQDELGRVVQEQRGLFDTGKNKTAEERATYDATSQRANDLIREIEDLKTLESREAMLLGGGAQFQSPQMSDEKRQESTFERALRVGEKNLTAEERSVIQFRATGPQSVGTPADGGYLVPTSLYNRITQAMKLYGGMLRVANVMTTETGNPLGFPTGDDTENVGEIVSENSLHGDGEKLQFGMITLNSFMFSSKYIRLSYALLRDSGFDLNAYVIQRAAERVGRIVNKKMTIGTGIGEPRGLVTAATSGVSAAASAITFDNTISLIHSVDPAYREMGAQFMFHDTTLGALRTIKDTQGRYIWDMGNVTQNIPASIWGYGYQINQDMPTIGTGKKSIIFGDLSQYQIRQVGSPRLKRNETTYENYDQVAFLYLQAYDGNLLNQNAVKALVHA